MTCAEVRTRSGPDAWRLDVGSEPPRRVRRLRTGGRDRYQGAVVRVICALRGPSEGIGHLSSPTLRGFVEPKA